MALIFACISNDIRFAWAQDVADKNLLRVESVNKCKGLRSKLSGFQSGGQWIVGNSVPIFGLPNANTPIATLNDALEKVSCYNRIDIAGKARVFVAKDDFSVCGWVDDTSLLDENRQDRIDVRARGRSAVCETPRAMLFRSFCERLERGTSNDEIASFCETYPSGLRTKGILTGASSGADELENKFFSAPENGQEMESRSFFSVLELHDLEFTSQGDAMTLVGDGEGDLFGWINLNSIRPWPTRLGLFYDSLAKGGIYLTRRDMIGDWRNRKFDPRVRLNGGDKAARDFIHGELPLLSYPIVRTLDPDVDPVLPQGMPKFHEVIFLGQAGSGAASELIQQSKRAKKIAAIRRINVIIAMDTTESMVSYLPAVQRGIEDFIRDYGRDTLDAANQLPDMRIAVYAYSDFIHKNRTSLNDPIRIERLMPPTRIGPGYDVSGPLSLISVHKGLTDDVGLFNEAALEAALRAAREFEYRGWFEDGPRMLIHIADHGSRSSVSPSKILSELEKMRVAYLPISVVTDDQNNPKRTAARKDFQRMAIQMLKGLIANPTLEDLPQIDIGNAGNSTSGIVKRQLDVTVGEAVQALIGVRQKVTGRKGESASVKALNRASSRILLDEKLREQYGLDEIAAKTFVQSRLGVAPFQRKQGELVKDINWTYTIGIEPERARLLQRNFQILCSQFGTPGYRGSFRKLILNMLRAFSGDEAKSGREVVAIFGDLANLPGAKGSFLAQSPDVLLRKIKSEDKAIQSELRKDVCWTSFHLDNQQAKSYARPKDVVWTGRSFALAEGASVTSRTYDYQPIVGRETTFLPSWFFILPSGLPEKTSSGECEGFFCE